MINNPGGPQEHVSMAIKGDPWNSKQVSMVSNQMDLLNSKQVSMVSNQGGPLELLESRGTPGTPRNKGNPWNF